MSNEAPPPGQIPARPVDVPPPISTPPPVAPAETAGLVADVGVASTSTAEAVPTVAREAHTITALATTLDRSPAEAQTIVRAAVNFITARDISDPTMVGRAVAEAADTYGLGPTEQAALAEYLKIETAPPTQVPPKDTVPTPPSPEPVVVTAETISANTGLRPDQVQKIIAAYANHRNAGRSPQNAFLEVLESYGNTPGYSLYMFNEKRLDEIKNFAEQEVARTQAERLAQQQPLAEHSIPSTVPASEPILEAAPVTPARLEPTAVTRFAATLQISPEALERIVEACLRSDNLSKTFDETTRTEGVKVSFGQVIGLYNYLEAIKAGEAPAEVEKRTLDAAEAETQARTRAEEAAARQRAEAAAAEAARKAQELEVAHARPADRTIEALAIAMGRRISETQQLVNQALEYIAKNAAQDIKADSIQRALRSTDAIELSEPQQIALEKYLASETAHISFAHLPVEYYTTLPSSGELETIVTSCVRNMESTGNSISQAIDALSVGEIGRQNPLNPDERNAVILYMLAERASRTPAPLNVEPISSPAVEPAEVQATSLDIEEFRDEGRVDNVTQEPEHPPSPEEIKQRQIDTVDRLVDEAREVLLRSDHLAYGERILDTDTMGVVVDHILQEIPTAALGPLSPKQLAEYALARHITALSEPSARRALLEEKRAIQFPETINGIAALEQKLQSAYKQLQIPGSHTDEEFDDLNRLQEALIGYRSYQRAIQAEGVPDAFASVLVGEQALQAAVRQRTARVMRNVTDRFDLDQVSIGTRVLLELGWDTKAVTRINHGGVTYRGVNTGQGIEGYIEKHPELFPQDNNNEHVFSTNDLVSEFNKEKKSLPPTT